MQPRDRPGSGGSGRGRTGARRAGGAHRPRPPGPVGSALFKAILVPLDGSPLGERALPYATGMARATAGRVILVRVVGAGPQGYSPAFEREATDYLRSLRDQVAVDGSKVETYCYRATDGSPDEAISEAVSQRYADVIAMSTHGRSGLGRWLYGSVAEGVLRESVVPVLLVGAACERLWPGDRPRRILVPLDGSPLAEEGLALGEEASALLGSELFLLRVDEDRDAARGYLEVLASGLRLEKRAVEVLVETGRPATTIATVAREQEIDLIAMTTRGRGGLAGLLLGSVAAGTLQQATTPLLLRRPALERARTLAGRAARPPRPADED
ncbi:MAG: universal stress protein [Chloroflexi bacterium]|nr:universal stress protein [Chloroflexota bacterium]